MPTTSGNKPTRLNIRVSEHEKEVITRAAETSEHDGQQFCAAKGLCRSAGGSR